ncbi:MAG: ABC transporter ATP-binding protein, partial [Clostridia bacterium]|nr:ABC transporter ATP-binding protein [Clostridia bacterium]
NGLDPVGIRDLRTIVSDFRERSGATVIVSSHNLHEVGLMCDRYLFINKGKIVDDVRKEELGSDLEREFFKRVKEA